MTLPTKGEIFTQLLEHLRLAQENAATIAHLTRDDDHLHAQGWMAVSEMFKQVQVTVTTLATKGTLQ
jgi:hypothetical protein